MDIYHLEVRYQIKSLWNAIYLFALLVVIILIFLFILEITDKTLVIILTNSGIFLLLMSTDVVLYFRYLKFSKNVWVIIDNEHKKIEIDVYGLFKYFTFNDVKSIERFCSAKAGQRKKSKILWGDFYYFVILLNNNEKIIITSLMTDKGDINIDGKKIEIIAQGNAWIPKNNNSIINLYKK